MKDGGESALERSCSCTKRTRGESIMVKRHRILSFLVCIALVTAYLGCASTRTQQSTGEKVDDSVITTKVKAAILDEPTLKVFQINVETFKGEVQLSGFVDNAQSVKKAGEVARGVKGVKSVKNNLIVK
jgi:osmotically-inducible protein OsmY